MTYDFIQTELSYICILICLVLSIVNFFDYFFEKQDKKWIFGLFTFFVVSVCCLFSLHFPENQILNTVILLGCTYVISLQYKIKSNRRILYSLLFCGISFVCVILTSFFLIGIWEIGFSDLEQPTFVFAKNLLSRFFIFVFFAVIKLKKHRFLINKNIKDWIIVSLFPITSLTCIFGQIYYICNQNESDLQQIMIILNIIFLIYCNHYIFKLINTMLKSAENERKLVIANNLLAEQERQYSQLFNNHNEIAKMHHDFKNVLVGIQADLKSKEYDLAMKHLQDKLSVVSLFDNAICGNQIIDTIVNNKIAIANRSGISIDFQYRNIQHLNIDSVDIAILLGNALDNAIEATAKLTDKRIKNILLMIILKGNDLNIIIKNPVEYDVNTDHLISNKKDKRFHGYGIINMKTVVDKYKGSLIFTCQDNIFRTTIILPNETSTAL